MKTLLRGGPNDGTALNASDGISLIEVEQKAGQCARYYKTHEVDGDAVIFSIHEPPCVVGLRGFIQRCVRDRERLAK